jgi:ferric reductase like protein
MLECSTMSGAMGMMSSAPMTSPQCYANDTPWLTTLAWCMQAECAQYNVSGSRLEGFWETQSTSSKTVAPKWGYTETLNNISQPPTRVLTKNDTDLNSTALVDPVAWQAQYNALWSVQRENVVESGFRYNNDSDLVAHLSDATNLYLSIAIILTGVGIPILLTWIRYLPYISALFDKLKPYLVYPSTIGTYSVRPLPHLLGNVPTVGQSLYIVLFLIINVILTAVNYKTILPHAWYANMWQEVVAFVFYRTGVFGFVLLPLLILFSSRNNMLLWLTNWSHSTYILLHRWVARIFTLFVLLHSILAVLLWKAYGTFEATEKETFWVWGIVATLCVVILAVASGLYVRQFMYEFFLLSHIILSIFVIIGCFYHIYEWTGVSLTWGYETWIYVAIVVWFFDRLVRVLRILRSGLRRSKVTDLGGGYVRVDIPGLRWGTEPGVHVYTYFPSLNPLRPWENHPFSVVPTALLQPSCHSSSQGSHTGDTDVEKHKGSKVNVKHSPENHPNIGVTLFIRREKGMTRFLQAHDGLLTLLDGPYPITSVKDILRCERVLLIGGGIGITSLLPWTFNHYNVKLCWSVRETAKCLVTEVEGILNGIAEKDVRVGSRLNITELLNEELNTGWRRVGVVACGPSGLCDDVRAAVVAAGKRSSIVFELEVDAYSW